MSQVEYAKYLMNLYGKRGESFLFIIDFDCRKPIVLRLDEVAENLILFDIPGFTNVDSPDVVNKNLHFQKYPVPFLLYKKAFEYIQHHISEGNTYLLNLTTATRIETNYTLSDLFFRSTAKFKLLYQNSFVVFSPEIFI
jgi:para-aminobenzoate synthetase component 1